MHITDFLLALQSVMPSRSELEAYGLSADEVDDVQATFKAVPRKESCPVANSELEKMILENDCSSVEIGLIRFLKGPRQHRNGVQIAYCEADSIVVTPSGTVAMYDHATPTKIMDCAVDSERFLEALNAFLIIRHEKSKWKGKGGAAANLCADRAGGPKNVPFFRLLCGFLE